ncbi:MAG TPA: MarR family transcriptional regulator [Jatrophihabitantaceae bacterium]|jgi:DNA-binding MarR family transcriptional regulator
MTRRLERDTWRLLRTLVLDRGDGRREVCETLELSFVRVKALRAIAAGPMAMRELVTALGTDPPYATVVVDDLEARGLVVRAPNPDDRRAKTVTVTGAGRRAARRADSILGRPPESLRRLDDSELAELHRLLTVLAG